MCPNCQQRKRGMGCARFMGGSDDKCSTPSHTHGKWDVFVRNTVAVSSNRTHNSHIENCDAGAGVHPPNIIRRPLSAHNSDTKIEHNGPQQYCECGGVNLEKRINTSCNCGQPSPTAPRSNGIFYPDHPTSFPNSPGTNCSIC